MLGSETVVQQTPVGNQCVRVFYQTTTNHTTDGNHSFCLSPYLKIHKEINNQEFTFSVYVKGIENSKIRLLAHAGPWGIDATTSRSPLKEATGKWQRISHTFTLSETGDGNDVITLRIVIYPNGQFDPTLETAIGTELENEAICGFTNMFNERACTAVISNNEYSGEALSIIQISHGATVKSYRAEILDLDPSRNQIISILSPSDYSNAFDCEVFLWEDFGGKPIDGANYWRYDG